jgi:hypothetical protein
MIRVVRAEEVCLIVDAESSKRLGEIMSAAVKICASLAAFSMVAVPSAASASWLSEITGIHINPSAGRISVEAPNIGAIPDMLRNLPKDAAQFFLNPAGAALAEAIRISRNTAGSGAQPIPPAIRQQLAPFFPAQILDKARFNTNKGALNLPAAIRLIDESYAVTLDDLIVFANSGQAQDPILWAHELTHVMQYDNMGVESFANIYSATGGTQLESQAREWALKVETGLQNAGSGFSPGSQVQVSSNAFTAPIPIDQFQQVAYQVLPPADCTVWNAFQGGVMISNSCPVGLIIGTFAIATPYGPQTVPCTFNCYVTPRTQMPFGPAPGPVVGVTFTFAPM